MKPTKTKTRRLAMGVAFAALLASIALATAAQAENRAHMSIIGGTTTTTEAWPWAAFILALDQNGEGFGCTGTVIAPTLVLTAGHCVKDVETGQLTPAAEYIVVTGSSDIRNKALRQTSEVTRSVIYPGFSRRKLHGDAGLLVLEKPTTAPPIALAGPEDAALYGPNVPASIAGWGDRGFKGSAKETVVLRTAETFVQRRQYCRNHSRSFYRYFNASTQLCTTTPPTFQTGTCHGDSGGPAIALRADGTPVQIGITSLGPFNCDSRLPDFYTRVDKIGTWIGEWIARTAPPVPAPIVPG